MPQTVWPTHTKPTTHVSVPHHETAQKCPIQTWLSIHGTSLRHFEPCVLGSDQKPEGQFYCPPSLGWTSMTSCGGKSKWQLSRDNPKHTRTVLPWRLVDPLRPFVCCWETPHRPILCHFFPPLQTQKLNSRCYKLHFIVAIQDVPVVWGRVNPSQDSYGTAVKLCSTVSEVLRGCFGFTISLQDEGDPVNRQKRSNVDASRCRLTLLMLTIRTSGLNS